VIIRATKQVNAQRAADLIHAARLLLDGSNMLSHLYPGEHAPIHTAARNTGALTSDESTFLSHAKVMTGDIPLACLIAARASWHLDYVYALSKLRLSFETFSMPFVELDPFHSKNVPVSPLPEDHVRLAFAIVAAWSCIEELGFAVNASDKKPSILPNGNWNPEVRQNLEARLQRGHVNLKELFHWNLRGPGTRIEKKRRPPIVQKASWAKYHVRDGTMEVIDAINYVSFLRSKVSAHKSDRKMLRVLSVYDVANAQFLARRLLLETMGYWRYWGKGRQDVTDTQ
jgi:hypothetical protein